MLFFFLLSWLWIAGIPDGSAGVGPGSQMTDESRPKGPKLQKPAEADGTYCCGPDIPPPKPPTGK